MASSTMRALDLALDKMRRNAGSIRRALWNAAIVTGGTATARMSAFLTAVMLARASGAATFGQFTFFTTVFILVSEIPNTFDTTYIRFANTPGNTAREPAFLTATLLLKTGLALSVVLAALFLAPWLTSHVFGKPGAGTIFRDAVIAGSLYCIFTTLVAVYQRQSRFEIVSGLRIAFPLLIACLVGLLIWNQVVLDQDHISALYIGCATLFALTAIWLLVMQLRSRGGPTLSREAGYLRVATVLLLAEFVNLASNRLDVFFLARFVSYDEMGVYGVAIRISVLVAILTVTIATILTPRAASATRYHESLRRYYALALGYALMQTLVALAVITNIDPVIAILFGASYESARDVAVLLILQVLVTAYGTPFQALIQCGRHPSLMFYISLARPALAVALLPYLIPRHGLTGAALAATAAAGTVTVLLIVAAVLTTPKRSTAAALVRN